MSKTNPNDFISEIKSASNFMLFMNRCNQLLKSISNYINKRGYTTDYSSGKYVFTGEGRIMIYKRGLTLKCVGEIKIKDNTYAGTSEAKRKEEVFKNITNLNLEISGRSDLEKLEQIAREIENSYQIKIKTTLVKDTPDCSIFPPIKNDGTRLIFMVLLILIGVVILGLLIRFVRIQMNSYLFLGF